jgi:hypothetical protein
MKSDIVAVIRDIPAILLIASLPPSSDPRISMIVPYVKILIIVKMRLP